MSQGSGRVPPERRVLKDQAAAARPAAPLRAARWAARAGQLVNATGI
jgi:hypothetical protein